MHMKLENVCLLQGKKYLKQTCLLDKCDVKIFQDLRKDKFCLGSEKFSENSEWSLFTESLGKQIICRLKKQKYGVGYQW